MIENIPLLVLAGGKASRLEHLSENLPKYLMPIQEGECFADLHLRWAKTQGFETIYLSVGHFAHQIEDYCKSGSKYGLKIEYFEDGLTLLGTGGALVKSLNSPYENLAVTYGDTLLTFDTSNFLAQFLHSKKLAGMTLYKNEVPGHQSNINFDQSQLIYDKANPQPGWSFIDYGFLALKREFIESFPRQIPLDLAIPLSQASYKQQVFGYVVENRFWEIGSPDALDEFRRQFT